jgi:hypothetical protein
MTEADPGVEQLEQERAHEAVAFVSIVAALAGLQELPSLGPDAAPIQVMSLNESIDALADAKHLPAPLRLELLARLHVAGLRQQRDLGLGRFASSLLRDSGESPGPLLTRLDNWVEGTDPLGRASVTDMTNESEGFAASLHDAVRCTALAVRPGCGAVTRGVQGHQALSIVTDMITCTSFDAFEGIVDPLQWPDCWLQGRFFKSMTPQSAQVRAPNPDGDGWLQLIEETCDFGFTMPGSTSPELRTHLNFLFFWNPPSNQTGGAGTPARVSLSPPLPGAAAAALGGPTVTPSSTGAAGCTYDFVRSVDNQILVDQGYLLVEELKGGEYRRYRTQKEVCFAAGNLPPDAVCRFWSLAIALIVQGCVT